MQVRYGYPCRKQRIVRVPGGHGSGSFCGQVVEFLGGNAVVDAVDYFFCYVDGFDEIHVKPVTKLLDPCGDLVKFH